MAQKINFGEKKEDWVELKTFKVHSFPEKKAVQGHIHRFDNPSYRSSVEDLKRSEETKTWAKPWFNNRFVHLYENVIILPLDYENPTSSRHHTYEEFSLDDLPTTHEEEKKDTKIVTTVTVDKAITDDVKFDEILLKDRTLCISEKLKLAKRAFTFLEFVSFVIRSFYLEISRFGFLDFYYFLVGLFLFVEGIVYYSTCKLSYLIFLVIPFSVLGFLTAVVNRGSKYKYLKKFISCFSVALCFGAFFKLIICILGVYVIYIHYPPEEKDDTDPKFCPSLFYWSAVYVFSVSILTYAVIGIIVVTVVSWYLL